MPKIQELIRHHKHEELWLMCCGFIDLSLEQFMAIQQRLLLEQIGLLKSCELGRRVMCGAMPETVEEFRTQVPLTTYADYCPELLEQKEDVLPAKPVYWVHTSGRSGEYRFKWIPISQQFWEEIGPVICATRLLSHCSYKGEVIVRLNSRILYATAPFPYTTGLIAHKCEEEFGFRFLPPLSESEQMSFMERLDKGFWMALSRGMEGFYGLSGILVAIGQRFSGGSKNIKLSSLLLKPGAFFRLVRGMLRSKLASRSMLPKDIWSVKGICCGGTDSFIYKDKIREMWGVRPLDVYAGTEGLIMAMQTWDYGGMTFIPNLNFLEFIPEAEHLKWWADNSYQPRTVLLDEVKAGENYEIVITNFHGGALARYRVGDMIRITALRNDVLGIDIPQMAFERRADELIDIAGFTRLTEKIVWQAIENTGIPYVDWTARKEIVGNKPVLRIFLELKDGHVATEQDLAAAVHDQLKKLDDDYTNLESILGLNPIEVTLLKPGAFLGFIAKRMADGADLAHMKPRHINPSEEMLSILGIAVKDYEPSAMIEAKG